MSRPALVNALELDPLNVILSWSGDAAGGEAEWSQGGTRMWQVWRTTLPRLRLSIRRCAPEVEAKTQSWVEAKALTLQELDRQCAARQACRSECV